MTGTDMLPGEVTAREIVRNAAAREAATDPEAQSQSLTGLVPSAYSCLPTLSSSKRTATLPRSSGRKRNPGKGKEEMGQLTEEEIMY